MHRHVIVLKLQENANNRLFTISLYVQIMVWRFLQRSKGSDVMATKQALLLIIVLQYIPRFIRIIPITSEMKRTTGVFAETAWAGAAYYMLLYMLASHVSPVWFDSLFLSIESIVNTELLFCF